jgi:uncharacterized protein
MAQLGNDMKGQIIGGNFDRILIRQKKGQNLEIGELLVCENSEQKILLQVIDLRYSSQVSQSNIEYISGMKIEEETDFMIMDEDLRYYSIAELKSILSIYKKKTKSNKNLPEFFSSVRALDKDDIDFMTVPKNPLFIGKLRSGSKTMPIDLFLDGKDVLSHHVLVAATTGRGKSNLTSCILWNILDRDYTGVLVLDPHDEYYGRNGLCLKDHKNKERVIYYTPFNVPSGCRTLKINLNKLKPQHFRGSASFTDAQTDAIYTYYKRFGKDWVKMILIGEEIRLGDRQIINEATLNVLRRKLMSLLNISVSDDEIRCNGIFDDVAGESTINDICGCLEEAKIVIIDTSSFSGNVEVLIGGMISAELFNKYKKYKIDGSLREKPVVSIVLEEAPRVLGKEVLERGGNIFSTIAKEGRKFQVGLFAITQLPSLIPKEILANMNTKIILGIEMASERAAIIDSAAQDLSSDSRNIASLDKGEALITSNFTKFATPVKIPLFTELVKSKPEKEYTTDFTGIKLEQ